MKAWLFDERFQFDRLHLYAEGLQGEWGAGDSIAEEEELPPAPQNVQAKPGNGRATITWDPVPEAMYYNLYFQTTKGVQIKFSELTRPIAGDDDFKRVIGVKKDKATCLEGATSPFVHDDLANGTCYHYVVTVVTPKGESLESQ
ncbi:MAG: fibronectin type III domain-containing protein, partial [Nitrospira sp.]|nr:fibronectin type III domain-containing protein [Nitrospira sp.]